MFKENLKNFITGLFDFEFIRFLLINVVFVDSTVLLVVLIYVILMFGLWLDIEIANELSKESIFYGLLILAGFFIILIVKISTLICYYNKFKNKSKKNFIVAKFFEMLKKNNKNKRCFLSIFIIPFLVLSCFTGGFVPGGKHHRKLAAFYVQFWILCI